MLGILRVIIGIFLGVRDLIGGVGGFVIIRMRDWVVILGMGFSCVYIFLNLFECYKYAYVIQIQKYNFNLQNHHILTCNP